MARVLRPGAEVDLVGRLDGRTAPLVRETLHACIDEGEGDLLLHIGSLEIWDAAGLGVLVGAHRRARRAGRRVVLTRSRRGTSGCSRRRGCTDCSSWSPASPD